MIKVYSKTVRGYSHIKSEKVCQDFSLSYHDEEKSIISCCDGHGGDLYIRSQLGSKFACNAVLDVFKDLETKNKYKWVSEELLDKLKLEILCIWNSQVECHYSHHPFGRNEIAFLDEDNQFKLKMNPEKAYGTTLIGCMLYKDKYVCIKLGDGECFAVKEGKAYPVFTDDDEETVANITYSMCAEDAFKHIEIKIIESSLIDGIILCTDGVVNPYQSYNNFNTSFVEPMLKEIFEEDRVKVLDQFMDELGNKIGIGDDASLSFIINKE